MIQTLEFSHRCSMELRTLDGYQWLELYIKLCTDHNIQPNETIVGKQPSNIEPTPSTSWEAFSKKLLLRYIQNFVIADDQVSFKMNLNIKPD